MKNIKKSCYLVPFLLVFGILSANAHEMSKSFLQGKWVITDSKTNTSSRVLFHRGHNHPKTPLMVFSLCADKKDDVYGRISNNLLNKYAKKLKLGSLTFEGHEFDMSLIPVNSAISADPLAVKFLHESTMNDKTILVSFDGGINYYTATRKNKRPTLACIQYMRKEKRKSR